VLGRPRAPLANVAQMQRQRTSSASRLATTAGAVALVGLLLTGCGSSGHHSASASVSGLPTTDATSSTTMVPSTTVATTTTTIPSHLTATSASWQLPDALSRPVALVENSSILLLGGLRTGDVSTAQVLRVDPAAGTTEVAGELALAVHDAAGAVIGSGTYVFGGGASSTVATVQSLNGSGATRVADLPDARSDLGAVTVGSTTYVLGGFDGTSIPTAVLATTDGRNFTSVGALAVGVRYPAVVEVDGQILVIGGVTGTAEGSLEQTDAIQRFDPTTGTSTVIGHLPSPLGHASAVVLDGQVFVAGGRTGDVAQSTIWRIDPRSGACQDVAQLPGARSDAGAVVVNGVGYLLGGELSGPIDPLSSVVELQLTS
jgi:hypothetical protein